MASCGRTSEFDMSLASRKPTVVKCKHCGAGWTASPSGASCCKIHIKFVSIVPPGQSPIVKYQSFSKK